MSETNPTPEQQAAPLPYTRETVLQFARDMRDKGASQEEVLAVLDAGRERHEGDADTGFYDAIIAAMDLVVGWCHPSQALFPIPEQRVRERWPGAKAIRVVTAPFGWLIAGFDNKTFGDGDTEEAAWLDAAGRLDPAPGPR
jgi:hypothetical protein